MFDPKPSSTLKKPSLLFYSPGINPGSITNASPETSTLSHYEPDPKLERSLRRNERGLEKEGGGMIAKMRVLKGGDRQRGIKEIRDER